MLLQCNQSLCLLTGYVTVQGLLVRSNVMFIYIPIYTHLHRTAMTCLNQIQKPVVLMSFFFINLYGIFNQKITQILVAQLFICTFYLAAILYKYLYFKRNKMSWYLQHTHFSYLVNMMTVQKGLPL